MRFSVSSHTELTLCLLTLCLTCCQIVDETDLYIVSLTFFALQQKSS